jgi:hypothetical protein
MKRQREGQTDRKVQRQKERKIETKNIKKILTERKIETEK